MKYEIWRETNNTVTNNRTATGSPARMVILVRTESTGTKREISSGESSPAEDHPLNFRLSFCFLL